MSARRALPGALATGVLAGLAWTCLWGLWFAWWWHAYDFVRRANLLCGVEKTAAEMGGILAGLSVAVALIVLGAIASFGVVKGIRDAGRGWRMRPVSGGDHLVVSGFLTVNEARSALGGE